MTRRTIKDKKIQKAIAKRRIQRLFSLAEKYALSGMLIFSNRYVELARKISMRYLVPIPDEFKHRFCKHCYKYLLPGYNSRIRLNRGKLIIYCHSCKNYTRIPLKSKTITVAPNEKNHHRQPPDFQHNPSGNFMKVML